MSRFKGEWQPNKEPDGTVLAEKCRGIVAHFYREGGRGHIRPHMGGQPVFVHINDVRRSGLETLTRGQEVKYDLVVFHRKPSAVNIVVLSGEQTLPDSDVGKEIGIVKWFNVKRRYGFVIPDAGGEDVLVHISEVEAIGKATLQTAQRLAYTPSPTKRGGRAAVDLELL